jgi:putative acyl-CoA dehydrogenase
MMRAVLADMALDVEAAVALVMRLARALDLAASDPREAAYARLMTPVAKYWICKLAPGFIFEAMECLGGNGFVEESLLPRLYREAPVNAIWEGSGNVMGLDVLRVLRREDAIELIKILTRDVLAAAPGIRLPALELDGEGATRVLIGRIAALAGAAALAASAPSAVTEAFIKARVVAGQGAIYGTGGIAPPIADQLLGRVLAEP